MAKYISKATIKGTEVLLKDSEARTSIDANKSEIDSIKKQLSTDEETISAHTTLINSLKDQVDTNTTNIAANTTEITSMQTTLANTFSEINQQFETDEGLIQTNKSNIEQTREEVSTQFAAVNSSITTLTGRVTTNEGNISTNTTNINNLQTQQTLDEEKTAAIQDEINDNVKSITNLMTKVSTNEANIATNKSNFENHTHNGTNSQRISYFDLTNQPSFNEARQYQTEVLTGSSGTITSQVHQCGTKPIIQFFKNGVATIIDWSKDSSGNITWTSGVELTQTDNAVIVVTGCSNDSSSRHDLENMWFGYEIDETESNPRLAVTRIAGSEAYKKAVFGTNGLLDGNLFRYISKSATDGSEIDITEDIKDYTKYSKYKYGGLNGEDGDRDIFAVPKSQLFFKVETEGDTIGSRILRKKISLYQLEGFQPYHVNHNVYIGLYEATNEIKDLSGNTVNYLCSKAMLDDDTAKARYYGGSNNATINKGMARTYLNISSFSNIAHNKNTSAITDGIYEEMDYMTYLMLYDLFICDFGTLHTQDGVNTARDGEGFRQGGLGAGISNVGNWGEYNNNNPIWLAGASTSAESNYKGSGCGEVLMTNPSGITGTNYMPVFYGIENIFGHIWQSVVGLHIIGENSAVSAKSYICNDPTIFSNATYRDNATIAQQESIGYKYEGTTPSSENYMKTAQFGAMGSLLPYAIGGSSGSYFCGYHYTAAVNGLRCCLFGGSSRDGAGCGFASLAADYGWTAANSGVGSRLCFFKEVSNEQ
jgi:predicted  nucleic acid-binding Zn-ribbon protein